jgi:ATP-dependent DNA helicase 2 subunit 2
LTTETKNIVNTANGGYENVLEYIPIAQPNAATIAKVDALRASSTSGDRKNLCLHPLQLWK